MKRLWWRARYTLWMWWLARVDLRTAWYCSGNDDEWETWSPRESATEELSYWTP
jgi:hypothetical protein